MATAGMYNWFRGFIQGKTRIVASWVFVFGIFFLANIPPHPTGLLLILLGASLRTWASGYLRKDNRPAIGGPYQHVRNPLYVGTYLMAVGTLIAVDQWGLAAILSVLYFGLYHYIVLDEEMKLERIFGDSYLLYRKSVPRFFMRPWGVARETRLKINPNADEHGFSFEIAKKNRAHEPFAAAIGIIVFLNVSAWFWMNR